jgi:DNA-binding transcriptional LysR family regulator
MKNFGLTDCGIFQRLAAKILERKIMSRLQLSRAVRIDEDKTKRVVDRLANELGVPLIAVGEDRSWKLTPAGRDFSELLMRMNSLADQEAPAERVTVLATPLVAQMLLPGPLAVFFGLWGSAASVTLPAVDGVESLRKEIREARGDFAVGFAETDEAVSADESLGFVPWVLIAPKKDHRLSGHGGTVSGEQFQSTDRVFLPGLAERNEDLEAFLAPIPRSGRVECSESVLLAMVNAGLGLAIIPDLNGNLDSNGTCKLAIEGMAPMQLRLVLPRKGMAGLSEPAEALVGNIRRACTRFAVELAEKATLPNGSPVALPTEELEGTKS